jgi:sterol desaturase/sphingolipid hydroxylase (fatty acid hydroxylase superfamily)
MEPPSIQYFMKPIPLFDYVGSPIFWTLFLALFWLQWKYPLRKQHFAILRRLVRNFVFSAPAFFFLRLTLIPIPLAAAWWAQQQGFGLLHWLRAPGFIAALAGFLIMDWAYYWWHYATHRVPLLWRFHNVHHTDLDLDVSTAARFHFGEIVASIPFRLITVVLFGIAPVPLLIFEIFFESASLFHHSNWRLGLSFERALNRVIVTPRMHGIHHSIVRRETDSNWGTIFSWWDRLHRTLRVDLRQDEIEIGVAPYREEGELTVSQLWSMPFRKQREWRLPDGTVPERQPHAARELQP